MCTLGLRALGKGGAVTGARILDSCFQRGGATVFCIETGRADPGFDRPEAYTIGGTL